MRLHSFYSVECVCGKAHSISQDKAAFKCSCGRRSIVDFARSYTERQLVEALNKLDSQRDHLARVLEMKRQAS